MFFRHIIIFMIIVCVLLQCKSSDINMKQKFLIPKSLFGCPESNFDNNLLIFKNRLTNEELKLCLYDLNMNNNNTKILNDLTSTNGLCRLDIACRNGEIENEFEKNNNENIDVYTTDENVFINQFNIKDVKLCCNSNNSSIDYINGDLAYKYNHINFFSGFQIQIKKSCPIFHHYKYLEYNTYRNSEKKYTICHYQRIETKFEECQYEYDGGLSYRGKTSVTNRNHTCLNWSLELGAPHNIFPHITGALSNTNYCRLVKPDFFQIGVYCHQKDVFYPITAADSSFFDVEFCTQIPTCREIDMRNVALGKGVYVSKGSVDDVMSEVLVDGNLATCFVQKLSLQPWIQIDLTEEYEVHLIRLEKTLLSNLVWYLNIYVSLKPEDFQSNICYLNYSTGNYLRHRVPCYRPQRGEFVILKSESFSEIKEERQLAFCEIEVLAIPTKCGMNLGMSSGFITKGQLKVSSSLNGWDKHFGRLYHEKAWCADRNDMDSFFQINLLLVHKIQGVLLQPTPSLEYISELQIEYSNDSLTWKSLYNFKNLSLSFRISFSTQKPHYIIFTQPIGAQFVKFLGKTFSKRPCMKFELIGCPTKLNDNLIPTYKYPKSEYSIVKTKSGKYCQFPFLYKKKLVMNCIRENADFLWCSLTYDYDKDGLKSDCLIPTYGGTANGQPCVFPTTIWEITSGINECLKKPREKFWCDSFNKTWGYCEPFKNPSSSMSEKFLLDAQPVDQLCSTLANFNRNECDIEGNITRKDCEKLGCCYFKDNSGPSCFYKKTQCGGKIDNPKKIYSPNYPFYYGEKSNCIWTISSPLGKYISLDFTDIDLPLAEKILTYDDMTLRNGDCIDELIVEEISNDDNNRKTTLRRFKNGDSKVDMISNTNMLEIRLVTCKRHSITENRGFAVAINFESCSGCSLGLQECKISTAICSSKCGQLASINYPSNYPNSQECSWEIVVGEDNFIEFTFDYFDIVSKEESCLEDYIKITDIGIGGNRIEIGTFCNRNTPKQFIYSSWNRLHIEFHSDKTLNSQGFKATYKEISYSKSVLNTTELEECTKNGWVSFNNSCYWHIEKSDKGITWRSANEECQLNGGGHLVVLSSQNEVQFIHEKLTHEWKSKKTNVHIGLSDKELEGRFLWLDGSIAHLTAWDTDTKPNQPDGVESENCVVIRLKSQYALNDWHDVACSSDRIYRFVCEKNIIPSKTPTTIINSTLAFLRLFFNDYEVENNFSISCPSKAFFTCFETKQCIPLDRKCDGFENCLDGSDEMECNQGDDNFCSFKCNNGKCLSSSYYCNFRKDCLDGSDENFCIHKECKHDEFKCLNGECIKLEKKCDLLIDCVDGSDELECSDQCNKTINFQCFSSTCLSGRRLCDGFVDCPGLENEDEGDICWQLQGKTCKAWRLSGYEDNGRFRINPSEEAGQSFKVDCDMNSYPDKVVNIVHNDNERFTYVTDYENWGSYQKTIEYLYTQKAEQLSSLVDQSDYCEQFYEFRCKGSLLTDGGFRSRSLNSSIKLWSAEPSINDNCKCKLRYACDVQNMTICHCDLNDPTKWVVDKGFITEKSLLPLAQILIGDTGAVTEEAFYFVGPLKCYEKYNPANARFSCKSGQIVDPSTKCLYNKDKFDDIIGCRDGSHLENCESFQCPKGFLKCSNSFCIPVWALCDKTLHCPNGDDELDCDNYKCPSMYQCQNTKTCILLSNICDGQVHCLNGDDERFCYPKCPPNCQCKGLEIMKCEGSINFGEISRKVRTFNLSFNAQDNNHFVNFQLQNTFMDWPYLYFLDFTHSQIRRLKPYAFGNLVNLRYLNLSLNRIERLESNTFFGLERLVSLNLLGNPLSFIDKFAFNGLANLKRLELYKMNLIDIQSDSFKGLLSLEYLDLSSNFIKYIDANNFVNLQQHLKYFDFSSNKQPEIEKDTLRLLAQLTVLKSDDFRYCCYVQDRVKSEDCLPPKNEISSCEDLMRNNILRAFVWIFGICAFVGNSFVLIFRLCKKEKTTVNSLLVGNLAVSDFWMGLYLLIIAGVDYKYRGVYVQFDKEWRNSLLCTLSGFMATVSSETSVATLCFITLDRFVCIVYPLSSRKLNKKGAWLTIVFVWIISAILAGLPLIPINYFEGDNKEGFYSRSGVCISLHLTKEEKAGWHYSVAVFVFLNFIAFLVIAVCYVYMYSSIKQSVRNSGRRNEQATDMKLARKMTLIVATDFLCWVPIGILGILALTNYTTPGQVYAWTVVFILPINSALNPFLYTISDLKTQGFTVRKVLEKIGILKKKETTDLDYSMTTSAMDITECGPNNYIHTCEKMINVCQLINLRKYFNTEFFIMEKNQQQQQHNYKITHLKTIFTIIEYLSYNLERLHFDNKLVGKINFDCVFVALNDKQAIVDVYLSVNNHHNKIERKWNKREDVLELGTLLKQILRNRSMAILKNEKIKC